jgi:hypothetical protein
MQCVHNDRLIGLGRDNAIVDGARFFVPTTLNSVFVVKFRCQRTAKPMNSRGFRCRGYCSSDRIPCSFPC